MANLRTRLLAKAVLNALGMSTATELVSKLRTNSDSRVYEAGAYGVFRLPELRSCANYVVSEYRESLALGSGADGIRNESLEALTFPGACFDVVITADVLEHVSSLDSALSEIARVLKPGGVHLFTVPVDAEQECTQEVPPSERCEMHGDPLRPDGIPAVRYFGRDVSKDMSRSGLLCCETRHDREGVYVASVFSASLSDCQ
jgi:SAM-dependent methyltransferase